MERRLLSLSTFALFVCMSMASLVELRADVATWNVPNLDSWTYPVAGDPGGGIFGPTFLTEPGLDEFNQLFPQSSRDPMRRGMTFTGFATSAEITPSLSPSLYQVNSVTVTFRMGETSLGGTILYDPTPETNAELLDDYVSGNIDTARPMELYGVGFQAGFTGFDFAANPGDKPFSEATFPYQDADPENVTPGDFNNNGRINSADLTSWEEDFGVNGDSDADNDGDSDGVDFLAWQRNYGEDHVLAAYPIGSDAAGEYTDVSNSLSGGFSATAPGNTTAPFEPTPWAIGTVAGLNPGDVIPDDQTFSFSLNLSLPGVTEYVQQGLSDGTLGFYLTSQHFAGDFHGGNGIPYPRWYTKEYPTNLGGEAPTLTLDYSILQPSLASSDIAITVPEPSSMLLVGLAMTCLVSIANRRQIPSR